MSNATLLFADNNQAFRTTRSEFLEQAGYKVLSASSPEQAIEILERHEIDVAILDIRLIDDDDDKDISGLTLAKEIERTLPKILLTDYPTVDKVREALKPQLDGLPVALDFVLKQDGPQVLIKAIQHALGPLSMWLKQVKQAIEGTDNELKQDYENAQQQAKANFLGAFIVALIGIAIIFGGTIFTFWDQCSSIKIQNLTTIAGLVTEAVALLFFKRVDAANTRMDKYHEERIQGRHFDVLLSACEGFTSATKRGRCRESVVTQATKTWLGSEKETLPVTGENGAVKGEENENTTGG